MQTRRVSLCVAIISGAVLHLRAHGQCTSWPVSSGGNGHCYELILDSAISWPHAQQAANALGGSLATITSSCEQQFVESLIQNGPNQTGAYWIGLRQAENGEFEWVIPEPDVFANWSQGEPNNYGGVETCGHLLWTANPQGEYFYRRGEWNDAPDSGYSVGWGPPDVARAGYIVELIPDSVCNGDLTGDHRVGLDDLAILLANFGSTSACSRHGDFDNDTDVDLADLAAHLAMFGTQCP